MLKSIAESQLEMILSWRNELSTRKVMFTQHTISMEEHLAWWRALQTDSTRECCVYYYNDYPAGLITYYNIDKNEESCYWGFFMNHFIPGGSKERLMAWLNLGKSAVNDRFSKPSYKRLLCETFEFNEPVLKLNHLLGFREVSTYQKERDGKTVNVIVMALDKQE